MALPAIREHHPVAIEIVGVNIRKPIGVPILPHIEHVGTQITCGRLALLEGQIERDAGSRAGLITEGLVAQIQSNIWLSHVPSSHALAIRVRSRTWHPVVLVFNGA